MAVERKTGTSIPAGILRPTTQLDEPPPIGAGGGGAPKDADDSPPEAKPPRRARARRTTTNPDVKLEGRRIYLSEGVHFRLRMLAYQRGRKISEVAEEVLDKGLPKYDVSRIG